MHSVFAKDVRYIGVDEWCDFRRTWILEFSGTCPQCAKAIRTYSTSSGSQCGCEGVGWSPRVSVTTSDLPASPWTRPQIRARALQVVAEAAATKRGKAAREIMAKLVKEFGRKAVDEALASKPEPASATGNQGVPDVPQSLPSNEQAPPILVYATYWETDYDSNEKRAGFHYTCPQCHDRFLIQTDTREARCKCEGITWRMTITIETSDFPPLSWHPDTIGAAALEELHSRFYTTFGGFETSYCKASHELWKRVEKEFDSRSVYASLKEV